MTIQSIQTGLLGDCRLDRGDRRAISAVEGVMTARALTAAAAWRERAARSGRATTRYDTFARRTSAGETAVRSGPRVGTELGQTATDRKSNPESSPLLAIEQ